MSDSFLSAMIGSTAAARRTGTSERHGRGSGVAERKASRVFEREVAARPAATAPREACLLYSEIRGSNPPSPSTEMPMAANQYPATCQKCEAPAAFPESVTTVSGYPQVDVRLKCRSCGATWTVRQAPDPEWRKDPRSQAKRMAPSSRQSRSVERPLPVQAEIRRLTQVTDHLRQKWRSHQHTADRAALQRLRAELSLHRHELAALNARLRRLRKARRSANRGAIAGRLTTPARRGRPGPIRRRRRTPTCRGDESMIR